MKTESKHITLDMWGVKPTLCNDLEFCSSAMKKAILVSEVTMISEIKHKFIPQGLTVLALLSESHMSIHTYPEHGYIAVDLFTCGERAVPEEGIEKILELFSPQAHKLTTSKRGIQ